MAKHEEVSDALIRDGEIADALKSFGSGFATDVADLIGQKTEADLYSAVVSSQFDADRLDYMRRDRLMTGTQHGGIDFEWLLSNLEVGRVSAGVDDEPLEPVSTFVLGPKAIFAAESYIQGLFQLYPTVYYHKATRGAEKLCSELLIQVFLRQTDGSHALTGLPKAHPLLEFAKRSKDLEAVLALDDTVVLGSLEFLSNSKDSCIAYLANCLKRRHLYKCIDVREELQKRIALKDDPTQLEASCSRAFTQFIDDGFGCMGDAALQNAVRMTIKDKLDLDRLDRACLYVNEQLKTPLGISSEPPSIIMDQATRRPYKRVQETKGPLEQIHIRSADTGELLDVATVSRVVAAVRDFKLLRAYVRRDDRESQRKVMQSIEEGATHALAA